MNRLILSPGAIPLDTDGGSIQRNTMIALGYLAQAAFGTGVIVDGLAVTATTVPSMTINVGPGAIFSLETIDATAFGSLALDANPLVKMGINSEGSTPFTLTAPTTSGQSINYLIEATFQEADGTPLVLPYYNPANPAQPYSGPSNSGATQNTVRAEGVELQLKAGASANTGTQTTPAVDAGWTGLYVITVNYGQTSITNSNLSSTTLATAPFIPAKLGPGMRPGFSQVFSTNTTGTTLWTVPAGVTLVKISGCAAGGGGGYGAASNFGSGGGGGAYAEKRLSVTPGQVLTLVIGTGGTGGTSGAAATAGGNTTFAGLTLGGGGAGGSNSPTPGNGGSVSGADLGLAGGVGFGGFALSGSAWLGGGGGGSPRFSMGGNYATNSVGNAAGDPGAGGGGGSNGNNGAAGANGILLVEW